MTKLLWFLSVSVSTVVLGNDQSSSSTISNQNWSTQHSSMISSSSATSKKSNHFKGVWSTQNYHPYLFRQRRTPGLFFFFHKSSVLKQKLISLVPQAILDTKEKLHTNHQIQYAPLTALLRSKMSRRSKAFFSSNPTILRAGNSQSPPSPPPPPPPPFVKLPAHSKVVNVYYPNIIDRTYTKPMIKPYSSLIPPPPLSSAEIGSARQKPGKVDQKFKHLERSFTVSLDQIPETPNPSLLKSANDKKASDSKEELLCAETKEKTSEFCYYTLVYFYQLTSRYVILDTEATGLGNGHSITEIGCVEIKNLQRTGNKFHMFINPEREVSSPAHKITGLTWKKLSKHPTFCGISQNLLRFFGSSPLVIHNQHYDLKLINESLNYSEGASIKLENERIVIDTQPFAKTLLPSNKVGLRALAQHFGVTSESNSNRHGALDDAEMLTDVFMSLLKLNNGDFPNNSKWIQIPHYDFEKELQVLELSPGKYIFQNLGFMMPLPKSLYFSVNMFHPKLFENFPAVVMVFKGLNNIPKSVLVKYDFNNQPLKYQEDSSTEIAAQGGREKVLFGVAEDATLDILSGSPEVTFIGKLINGLIAKEILNGERSKLLLRNLNIDSDYDIKACVDLVYLPTISFDIKMRRLIVLVDHFSTNDSQLSLIITKMLDKLNNQSIGLFNKIKQQSNLLDFVIKHNGCDWHVIEDKASGSLRHLILKSEERPEKLYIKINLNEKVISINDTIIDQPNSILIAPPKISLEILAITSEADGAKTPVQLFRTQKDFISKKFNSTTLIKSLKDLVSVNKTEVARKLYEQALEITQDNPVAQYFKKRRIDLPLPTSFRWMSNVFHPWAERNLPLTLVPLYNEKNVIVGVHRLFCDNDGSILKYTQLDYANPKKIPIKLSLGRTVGAAVEIFRDSVADSKGFSSDNHVMLISEGIENALVARDVCIKTKREHPKIAKELFRALNIQGTYSIKACVGINGLIDIPMDPKTQTVVILADNDYVNPDAKQTLINTVKHFLKKSLRTFIVLPTKPGGGKVDLNDVLLNNDEQNSILDVAAVMSGAVEIKRIEDLGDENNIPLEVNLRRLAPPKKEPAPESPPLYLKPKTSKTSTSTPSIQQAHTEERLSPKITTPSLKLTQKTNHDKQKVPAPLTKQSASQDQVNRDNKEVASQYNDLISDPFWHNTPKIRNARRK